MPRISTWIYSFKQGIKNIKRNRMFSLASVGTMTACLFLFGIFYFLLSNLQYMLKDAETKVGVTVFFDKGTTDDEIGEIGAKIKLREEVAFINFVSAEEAWEMYKEEGLSKELGETFGNDNPLANSASYEVHLNDVSMQTSLVHYIEEINGVRQVNSSDALAKGLTSINKAVGYITGAVTIILLGVATFLISTTVTTGVSVRRQEISIMKLIGATDFFIKAPFIVEGVIIGIIGAIIPLLFLYTLYYQIIGFISERFSSDLHNLQFLSANKIFSTLIPISLLIGIGIGFLGSYLTLGKQLKKIN